MKIRTWIENQSEREWLVLLTVVALVLRVGWAGLMADRQLRFDEVHYVQHAVGLSQGEGYVDEAKNKVAFWPVGYPFILSLVYRLTGQSRVASVGLQIIFGTLSCLVLYFLGKQTFGTLIARVASLSLAVYPNQVFFSTLHLTEPVFTLILLMVALLLIRGAKAHSLVDLTVAGLFLGLATLVRPTVLVFPLLLWVWFHRHGWRWVSALLATSCVFGSTLIAVSPWLIRNHELTGHWTDISTNGGEVFWVGNHPRALGGYHAPQDIDAPLRDGARYDWRRGYQLGWQSICGAPGQALTRVFYKISYFVALETDGVLWNLKGFERAPWIVWTFVLLFVANAAYLLLLGAGLLGLFIPSLSSPITTLFALLAGCLLMVSMIFTGDPRYHSPLVPFMLLYSSKALLSDFQPFIANLRRGDPLAKQRAVQWSVTMCLLVLMMAGNLWLKYLESQRF